MTSRLVPRKLRRRRQRWNKSKPLLARLLTPVYLLAALLHFFLFPFLVLLRSFLRSWQHRDKRHLLQGTLSLGAAGSVVLLAIVIQLNRSSLVDDYRDAALSAYRNEDFEAAKVYFERLIELDGNEASSRFDLALTLMQLGENERADAIMSALAPAEKTGFARAHLWLARKLLTSPDLASSRDKLQAARGHLMRAKQQMPGSAEIDFQLSQYALMVGRRDAAALYLAQAAKQRKELYFELSLLYASLNKLDLAQDAAYKADKYYRDRVSLNPDDEDARLRWASVRMNLNDFQQAVAILSEGVALNPDGPFQKALAGAFVSQYDRVMRQPERNHVQLVQLLREALKQDPSNPQALHRLIEFGEGQSDEANTAQQILEAMLVSGQANAFVHFVLGTNAWKTDNVDDALWHYERAYKLDETLGHVANNLAWILAHQETPQLERALSIMNGVLERWPNNPSYRDTRGQILAKLERWEQALDDLERAISGLQKNSQLHQTLANVYANLGRDRLSRKHHKVARFLAEQEQGSDRSH